MNTIDFGKKLSELRQNKGMTQEELAGRIGVTPQALSKWERNQSLPDIFLLTDLCRILNCSADQLLGICDRRITENNDEIAQNEIWKNLRDCLEPLELIIGTDLIPAFTDRYLEEVIQARKNLSKEGILMPLVHIRDDLELPAKEFTICAYHKILYRETIEKEGDLNGEYIIGRLEATVRDQYAEILNRDLINKMVENLKEKYPVLITETVPAKISYGLLTEIVKQFIRKHDRKGSGCLYLARIIEIVDQTLGEKGMLSAEEFAAVLLGELD